jgi:putative oxidoreductase
MNQKVVMVVRVLFGLVLIAFGAMSFMNFALPEGYPEAAASFANALADTGYIMYLVGLVEIAVGLMFISGRYVALGAILLAPITVNIILFHLFLDLKTILPALVVFALNIFIAYTVWDKYKPLLESK